MFVLWLLCLVFVWFILRDLRVCPLLPVIVFFYFSCSASFRLFPLFLSFALSLFLSWSLSALLLLLVLISLAHIAVISLHQRRMVGGGGVGLKEAVESGGVRSPQELPSTTLSPRSPWSTLPPPLHLPSLYAVHDSLLSVVAAVS